MPKPHSAARLLPPLRRFLLYWLLVLLTPAVSMAQAPAQPPNCSYAGTDRETAAFLTRVDQACRLAQVQTLRDTLVRTSFEYQDACFEASQRTPGAGLAHIEEFEQVRIQPLATAEYVKSVEEMGALCIVVFRDTAAAQACQRAIRQARARSWKMDYNPETTGPLREGGWQVLVVGRYVVWLTDAARCCPDLRRSYSIFRSYLYQAIAGAPKLRQPR
jgi:hypothetical protein